MTPAPIVQWVEQAYPKPKVDPDWLDACYTWIIKELKLDPTTQMNAIISNVESQLLESDLRDSMLQGTGLPGNLLTLNGVKICDPPVLVEIISMTEVGQSAFSLQNVRQTRIDRADLAGLVGQEEADEDDGPIPKYPRSMLRFELSDGTTIMPAIEYRSLPGLELGVTPLGYKMHIKGVLIRRGIAFLQPDNVIMKGHRTDEREALRERDFLRGLCRRLGKPEPEQDGGPVPPAAAPTDDHPNDLLANIAADIIVRSPSPPRESTGSPNKRLHSTTDLRNEDGNLSRKRRVPNPGPTQSSSSSASTLVASPYFSATASSRASGPCSTSRTHVDPAPWQLSQVLSPARGDPIVIEDSSMEDVEGASTSEFHNVGSRHGAINHAAEKTDASSEFDFGDDADMDDAFLAEIAQAEQDAMDGATSTQSAKDGLGSGILSPLNTQAIAEGVITIEDDDDEDKENIQFPSRRVRRRVGLRPTPSSTNVIDISDSD